jgi:enamidase
MIEIASYSSYYATALGRIALSAALRNGDVPAVAAVFTDGVPRFVGRSRNMPAPVRNVRVAHCALPRDFSGAAH